MSVPSLIVDVYVDSHRYLVVRWYGVAGKHIQFTVQLFWFDVGDAGPSCIILDDYIDSSKGHRTLIFTVREYHSPCNLL